MRVSLWVPLLSGVVALLCFVDSTYFSAVWLHCVFLCRPRVLAVWLHCLLLLFAFALQQCGSIACFFGSALLLKFDALGHTQPPSIAPFQQHYYSDRSRADSGAAVLFARSFPQEQTVSLHRASQDRFVSNSLALLLSRIMAKNSEFRASCTRKHQRYFVACKSAVAKRRCERRLNAEIDSGYIRRIFGKGGRGE